MRSLCVALAVAFAVCQISAGRAQPIQQELATRDIARQLANEVFELEGFRETIEESLATTQAEFKKSFSNLDEKAMDAILTTYVASLRANIDSYRLAVVDIYATSYSVDDLRGIIAFDQSPFGQHLIAMRPNIVRRAAAAQADWIKSAVDAALKTMPAANTALPRP